MEQLFLEINALSPDLGWSNYIYQTDDYLDADEKIDLDRLIAKLKEYRPIVL